MNHELRRQLLHDYDCEELRRQGKNPPEIAELYETAASAFAVSHRLVCLRGSDPALVELLQELIKDLETRLPRWHDELAERENYILDDGAYFSVCHACLDLAKARLREAIAGGSFSASRWKRERSQKHRQEVLSSLAKEMIGLIRARNRTALAMALHAARPHSPALPAPVGGDGDTAVHRGQPPSQTDIEARWKQPCPVKLLGTTSRHRKLDVQVCVEGEWIGEQLSLKNYEAVAVLIDQGQVGNKYRNAILYLIKQYGAKHPHWTRWIHWVNGEGRYIWMAGRCQQ